MVFLFEVLGSSGFIWGYGMETTKEDTNMLRAEVPK